MKRCASCGREVPETATVCDLCERWAADQIHSTAMPPLAHTPAAAAELLSPPPSAPPTFAPAPQTVVSAPPAQSTQPHAVAAAAPPRARRSLSRRELMIIAATLVIGSAITFALGGSRDAAPTTAAPAKATASKKATTAAAAPASRFTQTWSASRRAYWTANQRHAAAFELPAENTVAIWMNYVRPILVVRCMNKRMETFVYTGSALKIEPNTEDHTVNFRFDDQAGRSEHWPDSAEHDALFAPDGAAFAQQVLSSKTFRFGYTPHNAEPVEAQFHVDGLTELIAPAAKDCGWQK